MGSELSRHVAGYARVSTGDQDLASQVERIRKYISDYGLIPAIEGAIFQEKMSVKCVKQFETNPRIKSENICSYPYICQERKCIKRKTN